MTPGRLVECIQTIGWSQRRLADFLGRTEMQIRRYLRGEQPIPASDEKMSARLAWIEKLTRFYERHPPP